MKTFGMRVVAVVALLGALAGGCGGGGGSSGGSSSTGSGTAELVIVRREHVSPGAPSGLWVLVERLAGESAATFRLEESLDGGLTYSALATVATLPAGDLARFELPIPAGPRRYRLAAPRTSPALAFDPAATGPEVSFRAPLAGERGIDPTATLEVQSSAPLTRFLWVVADEDGEVVTLAIGGARLGWQDPPARAILGPKPLARGGAYLATAVALSPEGVGLSAAPRIDFHTAP